jgi:hypothetical protein
MRLRALLTLTWITRGGSLQLDPPLHGPLSQDSTTSNKEKVNPLIGTVHGGFSAQGLSAKV